MGIRAERPSIILWLAVLLIVPAAVFGAVLEGRLLVDVLDDLRSGGLQILYSDDLVKPWMRVRVEPDNEDPLSVLESILAPYGLASRAEGNLRVVIRANPPPAAQTAPPRVAAPASPAPPKPVPLAELVVSASRYRLDGATSPSTRELTSTDLRLTPNVGDDPLRVVARLPGAAAGDLTARPNIRGGEYNETLIRFDDLRLVDPFHLRDFQAVFSAIDPALVDRIDVYTGAFPVAFGNRMSSVIDVSTLPVTDPRRREISLSFFNASVLLSGATDDGRTEWTTSLRRGNLDLIIDVVDPARGKPRYIDGFARVRHHLNDDFSLSASLLASDDNIRISDNDAEEQATAGYRDLYLWLRADWTPGDRLSGYVLLSQGELSSLREGIADQPGIASGELRDERDISVTSLLTEWDWQPADGLLLQFGAELRHERAEFRYRDAADFDLVFLAPGAQPGVQRRTETSTSPRGKLLAVFANARLEVTDELTAELGLRWDRNTLVPGGEDLFSPRLNLLYRAGPATRFRLGWGQFYQGQGIHELQVNDGLDEYLPAQSARHLVAGWEQDLPLELALDLEIYDKSYDRLRPRYENFLDTFRLLPELKPDRIRTAPAGANARGLELTLANRGGGPLGWWMSYGLARAEDEFQGGNRPRNWDQRHTVNAGMTWSAEHWEFGAAWRWHSGWPTTDTTLVDDDPVPVVLAPNINGRRLDSYRSLDLRVARNWFNEEGKGLLAFLEIRNIFNRRNPCCVEYEFASDEGPPAFATETVQYPGLIPSLGFTWRF